MTNSINPSALAQNIADQCKQFEESQEYKDMITNAVKKLYANALDDVFRWGDFPDQVKEAIKNAMPASVSDFVDLAKYNTLMMNALKASWETSDIQDHAVKQVQAIASKAVEGLKIPEFVLMSELCTAFIESNSDRAAEENWEKPNILLQESDSEYLTEYWELGFESEPEGSYSYRSPKTRGFEFENCLNIKPVYTDRRGKTFKMHDNYKCYELYAGKVSNNILGKKIVNPHCDFERLICALYFGSAYLVWDDCDPSDIYYPHGY